MQALGSQTQITQAFGQEAPKAVGDYAKEKTKPYEYAQMVEGQLTDALTKTTDPEQRQAILSNLAKVQAYKQQHEQDYNNWKEGGAYRVAAHTAIGALGGGTVQSALTAGGTAAAAPMITEVEKKIADNLAKQGIDATTAGSIANSLTGLTLTGIGASAGLDMSSMATAVNIDANNRQLHPDEMEVIKKLAPDYAVKENISIDEAKRRLVRGALYNIDASWRSTIDHIYEDNSQEIAYYSHAYNYLLQKTKGNSYGAFSSDSLPEVDFVLKKYSDPKAQYYLGTVSQGEMFTATPEDFNNSKLFLNTAFNDNSTMQMYDDYANMRLGDDVKLPTIIKQGVINGAVYGTGLIVGTKNAVTDLKNTAESLSNLKPEDIANVPVTFATNALVTGMEVVDAVKNPKETFNKISDTLGAVKESLKDEANYQKLLWLQYNDAPNYYQAGKVTGEYGIPAAATEGVGLAASRGISAGSKLLNEGAKATADTLTPRPALVTGAIGSDGATAVTGLPNGAKTASGSGAAAGAILSVGDAPGGTYTQNPDGSHTGSGGGRATSTGKFDENGEEIYQRGSGGYYIVDKNGIQRSVKSPNEHGNTLGDQPAELYCLECRRTGEVLKYGETTHGEDRYGVGNQKRYSTDYLEENNAEYKKLDSGTKTDMHKKQTELINEYKDENGGVRPPLNKSDY